MCTMDADIENVMSVPNAACINFEGWDKTLHLEKHFLNKYALTELIVYPFQCNYVGKVRVNTTNGVKWVQSCDILVKNGV